jgi:hypothetical protein
MKTPERRRQARFEAKVFAELESLPQNNNLGRGVVLDVSIGGFAVETEADLSIGSDVGCYIEVPVYVRAKVVRSIVGGQIKKYGLRFAGQSFLDKMILRKILKGPRQTRKI